jgi:preprotein translocase subunit SecG
MIETLVLIGHLLVAMTIVLLVLLQRGKGAEAGTGFGAGASGTVFGARGSASFFSRATAILATLFFATSLALAYFSTQTAAPERLVESPLVGGATPVAPEDVGKCRCPGAKRSSSQPRELLRPLRPKTLRRKRARTGSIFCCSLPTWWNW